jgi:exodeoxyribonuclease-3
VERRGNSVAKLQSCIDPFNLAWEFRRSPSALHRGRGEWGFDHFHLPPNGNPQPGPKFNYKLAWFERLLTHAAELIAAGVPVVLAGDYNVVPTPQDIYPTRSLDNNALIQPESRQAFTRLLAQGWTDAMRKLHPEGPLWTFRDYKRERWPKGKGMRLDHFLLSPEMSERLVDGGVDRWVRGEANAGDHAPVWTVLDL